MLPCLSLINSRCRTFGKEEMLIEFRVASFNTFKHCTSGTRHSYGFEHLRSDYFNGQQSSSRAASFEGVPLDIGPSAVWQWQEDF
jgi:hypothetical protein